MSGIEIVVRPWAGTWKAECDGLLPFGYDMGESPREAVVRFLRRAANYYGHANCPPLPMVVRVLSPRKRVFDIGATSNTALSEFGALPPGEPRPMEIVVARRVADSEEASGGSRRYPYTDRRWQALMAAFGRLYGNGRPVPKTGKDDPDAWRDRAEVTDEYDIVD